MSHRRIKGELLLGMVVRDRNIVLASYALRDTEHVHHLTDLLRHARMNIPQMEFTIDDHIFVVHNEKRFSYICLVTEDYNRRVARAFLSQLRDYFVGAVSEEHALTCIANSLNGALGAYLDRQVHLFNTTECDQVAKAQQQVDEATEVVQENLRLLIGRGDDLGVLSQKASSMMKEAQEFKHQAKELKCMMCLRKWYFWVIIVIALAVLVCIIIGLKCGWNF